MVDASWRFHRKPCRNQTAGAGIPKKYILLALCLGWVGGHRFYTKQYALGFIYLLFCWTGIPFAMTLIDLMIALPRQADEQGRLFL
ncbi:TM2 domain-containing protein [Hungatella sp.]|uniref:TM2 domain-containing protein n=1 Tax=Hungatella sp. TaxID=2613924 RepID=UPI0039954EE0